MAKNKQVLDPVLDNPYLNLGEKQKGVLGENFEEVQQAVTAIQEYKKLL